MPAVLEVRSAFKTSTTLVNSTISLYILALGIAVSFPYSQSPSIPFRLTLIQPLAWAPLSERHGRRIIYIVATIIYVASTVGCALSPNIKVFIILRISQAAGSSAAQAVGAG